MYEIVAWTAGGLGAVLAAYSLVRWAMARAQAGVAQAKPGATTWDPLTWVVRSGVLLIAVGLAMLGTEAGSNATVWTARLIFAAVLLALLLSWLRANALRKR
jgi:hypothetical protein